MPVVKKDDVAVAGTNESQLTADRQHKFLLVHLTGIGVLTVEHLLPNLPYSLMACYCAFWSRRRANLIHPYGADGGLGAPIAASFARPQGSSAPLGDWIPSGWAGVLKAAFNRWSFRRRTKHY